MGVEEVRYLKKIDGKFRIPEGIVVWGEDAEGNPVKVLVDGDGRLQVDVLSMPSVSVEPSFKDAAGVPHRALVDADQHVQVDVLSSALPSGAATEETLSSVLSRFDITLSNLRNTLDSRIYDPADALSVYDQIKQVRTRVDSHLPNMDVPVSSLLRIRVYDQTFEEGTSDLTAENCTQTVQTTEVYGGSYALDVSIADGVTGSVTTPARPVSANQRVTFSLAHKENAYISDIKLAVIWRRSSGGTIDAEEYALTPSTSWQVDSRTLTAPQNATTMELQVKATASGGEGHAYLDELTIDLVGQILRTDAAGNVKVTDDMLDVGLSTRASEATLSSILSQLDITLSSLRDSLKQSTIDTTVYTKSLADVWYQLSQTLAVHEQTPWNPPNLDVALSTRASESSLTSFAAQAYDSANDRYKINAEAVANPPNLDVALSTRASEDTLRLVPSRWIPPGATEKSWSANASPTAAGDSTLVDYVPDSGKTVRITDITVSADVDGHARVMWGTTQLWKQFLTAKIPGGQSFTRALSVTGDGTTHLQLIVYASAAGNVTGTMLGYEV
ncbi:MAG: hypothetical protein JRD89_07140 [Deltaproteobacteria bacterium]|nr:hypothetical protein [Deltaproteobacteria bacterium]